MPNKEILIQYATLKLQAKKIEDELEMLKAQVQAEVEAIIGTSDQQVTLSDLPGVSLSLAKARAKWEYTPQTRAAEEALKETKKEEEQTGLAVNLNDGKRELRVNLPKE